MHWKSFDYRITSLMLILEHLENAIDLLFYKLKENDWYDGLFLMEEREPLYMDWHLSHFNKINVNVKILL